MFTALSDNILKKKGLAYGCVLNDDFLAEHRMTKSEKEHDAFRGSKYIQSDLNNIFRLIKENLKNNQMVLFSGTPYQCVVLENYITDTHLKKTHYS